MTQGIRWMTQQPSRWAHRYGAESEETGLSQSWEAEHGQLAHRICGQGYQGRMEPGERRAGNGDQVQAFRSCIQTSQGRV